MKTKTKKMRKVIERPDGSVSVYHTTDSLDAITLSVFYENRRWHSILASFKEAGVSVPGFCSPIAWSFSIKELRKALLTLETITIVMAIPLKEDPTSKEAMDDVTTMCDFMNHFQKVVCDQLQIWYTPGMYTGKEPLPDGESLIRKGSVEEHRAMLDLWPKT